MSKDFWMGVAVGGFGMVLILLMFGIYAEAYLPK